VGERGGGTRERQRRQGWESLSARDEICMGQLKAVLLRGEGEEGLHGGASLALSRPPR